MLICRIGTHEIYRIDYGTKKRWECATCANGKPGHDDYPCRGLKTWFWHMQNKRRPPPEARFTEAGAEATLGECKCLNSKGVKLVREQIEREPPKPPPAPTGRNKPCPCGSGGKYKQCCGWVQEPEETRGPRKYWPPGDEPEAETPPSVKPAPPEDLGHKRRKEEVEREERKAATWKRVDATLDTMHKADEVDRMCRAARKLARLVAAGSFEGQRIDGETARRFEAQAAQLRAEAAQLRATVKQERAAQLAARRAELAQEAERAREKRRAQRAARKARQA